MQLNVVSYEEFNAAVSGLRDEIKYLRSLLPAVESPKLLTPSEAADYCRISVESLNRARRDGRVKGLKANEKQYAYTIADLDVYLKRYYK